MSDGLFPSANDAKSTFLLLDKSSTDMLGRSLLNIAALGAALVEAFGADFGAAFFVAFALVAAKDNVGEATMAATEIAATKPKPRRAFRRRDG
jgi:ethanolamine ammonia-lyase small subunit